MPNISITIHQRKNLRDWYQGTYPRPSQKSCIQWFKSTFDIEIKQCTVSTSLSKRFEHLDEPTAANPATTLRSRSSHWPELEAVLFQWQSAIQTRGGTTTGDVLCEKAKQIWQQLPQYQAKPTPNFTTGWLRNFKNRHRIREYAQHGEAGSFDTLGEEEMASIRTIAGLYQEEDIYNMDETGLFWKMTPSRGLSTERMPGLKKNKARITLTLCSNATGSDKLPIWFVGKAKNPRAMARVNIRTMGGYWRWNQKAWMNQIIMKDWLEAFYAHIGTRTVLLTMDNFSAHLVGLELAPPPPNVRICWLPPNTTSRFQPLDQGIIQSFKCHYRRQWLQFMLTCFESEQDPLKHVNVYLAIRWSIRAWHNGVSTTTIYNCF